jgi:glycosyltransferase involved in cell wall biosynthesis
MNIGGPSIHVSLLTRKLDRKRFDSKLLTGTISAGEGDMSYLMQGCNGAILTVPELQREIDLRKDLRAFLKLFQTIINQKPQIVHTHTAKAGTVGRLAAGAYQLFSGRHVTLVHTFHGNVLEGYFSPVKSKLFGGIERLLARLTDAIIAISPTQKWDLVEKHGITEAHKVHTINLGFDLSPFTKLDRRRKRIFRDAWKIDDDVVLIGIVGRMVPIKNHRMFLEAAQLVLSRNDHLPVRFVIVGDGELRSQLETYAADLGIREKVLFIGWVRDIPQIYADLDILALTSVNEGTPVSVIEAMAASVPVVSTGVGGIKDLLGAIEDRQPMPGGFKICQRGILCPKEDPDTFSKALAYMIESGYLQDNGRFSKARDYVLKNYSVERLVDDVESLYEKLLNSKRSWPRPAEQVIVSCAATQD